MTEFDDASAKALKILGKDAKIPQKHLATVKKAQIAYHKEQKEFTTAVDAAEKKLLALQNSVSAMRNAIRQFDDEVSNSDYDLDAKNADNKKKIKQAEDMFAKFFADVEKKWDDEIKDLDELDKHMMNIGKYKGVDTK